MDSEEKTHKQRLVDVPTVDFHFDQGYVKVQKGDDTYSFTTSNNAFGSCCFEMTSDNLDKYIELLTQIRGK